jgi:hypothetical protein
MSRRGADSLTVFVISTGEEVLDDCLAALEAQTRPVRVERIDDVFPMSAAFQAMPDRCETPYFLQVDADMVLEPFAAERLHDRLRRTSPRVFQVSGQLYEDGFGVGGAVKCWKRSVFRWFSFADVRTVDRDLYRRTRRFGLGRKHIGDVVGRHVPRHSPESEFLKAKGDVEKWRFLGREAERYALPLVRELLADATVPADRLTGALLGALTTEPRLSRSKDIRHERAIRAAATAALGAGPPGAPPGGIEELFAAAYAGGPREPLAAAIAAWWRAPQAAGALLAPVE